MNETHGLTSQKRHRLNVSGRVNVRRDTDESLNRNLRSGDRRSSNDRLLGLGPLRFAFTGNPLIDERGSQGSVWGFRPTVPKENRANRIFLGCGGQSGLVFGVGVGFDSG